MILTASFSKEKLTIKLIEDLNKMLLYSLKCDILLYRILLYNKIKMENKN